MADIEARYGLNDSEFIEGLRDVEKRARRHAGDMESMYATTARRIGTATAGALGAWVGIGASIRFAARAVAEYGQANDQAAGAQRQFNQSWQSFRRGLGSDLSLLIETGGALVGFIGRLDQFRRSAANAVADALSLRSGQGAEIDAIRRTQEQQTALGSAAERWFARGRAISDQLTGGSAVTEAMEERRRNLRELEESIAALRAAGRIIAGDDPAYVQAKTNIEALYAKRINDINAAEQRLERQRLARFGGALFRRGFNALAGAAGDGVGLFSDLLGPLRAVGQRTDLDKMRDAEAVRVRTERERFAQELASERILLRRLRGDERGAELAERRLDLERRIAEVRERLGDTPEARALIEQFKAVDAQIGEALSGARAAGSGRFPVSAPAGLGAFVPLGTATDNAVQGIGRTVTAIERHLQRIAGMTGGAVLA